MSVKNYYPEKPVLPYKKTTIEMAVVINAIRNSVADKEVKRSAYVAFRNESNNGKSGLNFNFCGFQADSGRWDKKFDIEISGVVKKVENGTGKERWFLAFDSVNGCIDMLLDRMQGRGIYVGGTTHKIWVGQHIDNKEELARAYYKEWVRGDKNAEPSEQAMKNYISMYNQAEKLFI